VLVARAAYLHFRSVANQVRFVLARDELAGANVAAARKAELTGHVRRILQDEMQNARELLEIVRRDSRIGFEASNQYYYVPQDLMEKVINCRYLLDHLEALR